MVETNIKLRDKRLDIIKQLRACYTPFFKYDVELKKNIYKVTFCINGSSRTVRCDPQFPERELEDLIAAIENSKNAFVDRIRSYAVRSAEEGLRKRIDGKEFCGHIVRWTYAFEIENGFSCPLDKLFLPVSYSDEYGDDTYETVIDPEWEERAFRYFVDNMPNQTFTLRGKCPEQLKGHVLPFVSAQSMLFSGHDKYICTVQREMVPSVDRQERWHFEFGDFTMDADGVHFVADSGVFGEYDKDKDLYINRSSFVNRLVKAAEKEGVTLSYSGGTGLTNGVTKVRFSYGPWFMVVDVTPDMEDWEDSVRLQVNNGVKRCRDIIWKKIHSCFGNGLCQDVARLININSKATLGAIELNLKCAAGSLKNIPGSGKYGNIERNSLKKAVSSLLGIKIIKKELVDKGDKSCTLLSSTDWGKEIMLEYMESQHLIN